MKKNKLSTNICMSCDAGCCRTVAVQWEKPTCKKDWEQIRWLVAHKNISVYLDEDDDWLIEFKTDCTHIGKDNRCLIYDKRMPICREHPSDACEMSGDEDYYLEMYRTTEDVDALIAKKYGKKSK
jgi:Fe-S-cluster containining protein